MSQATTWSVPTVGPASMAAYSARADDSFNALLSLQRGSSRPSYAVAGTLWIDDTSTPWVIKLYDGTQDATVGTVDPATGDYVPYSNGAAILAQSIASQAEAEAGTETTKRMTPERVAQAIRVLGAELDTAQATTSGRAADFTIPSWARKIECVFDGLSIDGTTDAPYIRIGTGGTPASSGYTGSVVNYNGSAFDNFDTAFLLVNSVGAASYTYHGRASFNLIDPSTHQWAYSALVASPGASNHWSGAGSIDLGGACNILRLGLTGSTDDFDAGKVNVRRSP